MQLLYSSSFGNYKIVESAIIGIGGLAKKSPICLQTMHSSHWHVAVDLHGLGGNVKIMLVYCPPLYQQSIGNH